MYWVKFRQNLQEKFDFLLFQIIFLSSDFFESKILLVNSSRFSYIVFTLITGKLPTNSLKKEQNCKTNFPFSPVALVV